jgi:hypothetical protein
MHSRQALYTLSPEFLLGSNRAPSGSILQRRSSLKDNLKMCWFLDRTKELVLESGTSDPSVVAATVSTTTADHLMPGFL